MILEISLKFSRTCCLGFVEFVTRDVEQVYWQLWDAPDPRAVLRRLEPDSLFFGTINEL
jgi:hypothetical protein